MQSSDYLALWTEDWPKMKSLQDQQTHPILSVSALPLKYVPGCISKWRSPCQSSAAVALPTAWQLYHLPPSLLLSLLLWCMGYSGWWLVPMLMGITLGGCWRESRPLSSQAITALQALALTFNVESAFLAHGGFTLWDTLLTFLFTLTQTCTIEIAAVDSYGFRPCPVSIKRDTWVCRGGFQGGCMGFLLSLNT